MTTTADCSVADDDVYSDFLPLFFFFVIFAYCLPQEVDVVFEEDVGFLGALRDLRGRAKCPVILTSECYRQEYAPLNCHIFYLPRPRLVEVRYILEALSVGTSPF